MQGIIALMSEGHDVFAVVGYRMRQHSTSPGRQVIASVGVMLLSTFPSLDNHRNGHAGA